MRIRPEAQAILDRCLPERLDSLWCEVLASGFGGGLLEVWDLTLEEVRASAPLLACDGQQVLRWAGMFSHVNAPVCTAEWVAEDILMRGPGWQGPALAHFTAGDVEYHEVDIREVYALAFEEGLEEALQRHYLQAARAVWPVLHAILEFCDRDLDSFDRPYHCTGRNGPVDTLQLAQACLRHDGLTAWMESLGVAEWQLRHNLLESDLRGRVRGEKLHWLKPACEEARLCGSPTVDARHLLLALLGELHGPTVRVLREHSVDVRALRRRLKVRHGPPLPASEMVFDPTLLEILQAGCALGGEDPYSGVLLRCLLEQVEFAEIPTREVLPSLQRILSGSLVLDSLSMDGLRLGMGEVEVLQRLGPPAFRKEACWMYRDTSVMWKEGRVFGVLGKRLESGSDVLEMGSPWTDAERVLGALRLWNGGPGPAWALISGGKVRMLTLSLEQDSPPE